MSDGWNKVGGGAQTTNWDYAKIRQESGTDPVLEGIYVEKREKIGANESTVYVIETASGDLMSVWENMLLADRFSKVNIGDMVRIVYQGKMTSPKTKRSYHSFEFFRKAATDNVASDSSTDDIFDMDME